MNNITPLDFTFATMQENEADTLARLRFYECLSDAELFLLLETQATGDTISPKILYSGGRNYVSIFDSQERLIDFANSLTPYAALSGRTIIEMILGQDVGLALNLGVAPSSILLPTNVVDWLSELLSQEITEQMSAPKEISAPSGIPPSVLNTLGNKLIFATGLANSASLVRVEYYGGNSSYLLAYVDARKEAQAKLTQIVADTIAFSGVENETIDVAFFNSSDVNSARLAGTGFSFDLTQPEQSTHTPSAPGVDPKKPPRLN